MRKNSNTSTTITNIITNNNNNQKKRPEGWRSLITESQVSCVKIPKTKNEKCICSFLKAERNQLVVASESGKVSYYKIIEGEEKPEQLQEFDVKLY